MTGYEALRSSAASIDVSDRGKIRITGEDRVRLLHAMTTNDIQSLPLDGGCYVYFLTAQGRILADANVYQRGDYLFVDTEPELPAKLYEHLDKYIIADDVTLADETSEWAAIGVEGPASEQVIRKLGIGAPTAPLGIASWQDGFVAAASVTGARGFRLFVPAGSRLKLIEALRAAGIPEADKEAVEIVRLEHGTPRYGADISERYLTQETNQMHAVSFTKGCYIGQEIVERVRSRAQIHRVLHPVRIKGNAAPAAGAKLVLNGAPAGEITSAAFSPAFGEVAALGYVKVEHVQAKPVMTVAGTEPALEAYVA